MAKRQFQLRDDQIQELVKEYSTCKDGPTRTRYQAVRLYGTGYLVKEISAIAGCSRASLMEWCQKYRREGVKGLTDHRAGGNRARLSAEQLQALAQRLRQYTPRDLFGDETQTEDGQFWTVEDLHRAVAQWYGVTWQSRTSYYKVLADCGFSYQRPVKVFKSRRESQVADFEERLEKN
jgi:transposase